jgi:hypothetical protein
LFGFSRITWLISLFHLQIVCVEKCLWEICIEAIYSIYEFEIHVFSQACTSEM